MDFFISTAQAQQEAQGSAWVTLLFPVLLLVIFYFLLIRPQAKRAKEHKQMVAELDKGDEVVTQGGLLGRITDLDEGFITLEINDSNQVKVQRSAVVQVVPKGTLKGRADSAETKKAGK